MDPKRKQRYNTYGYNNHNENHKALSIVYPIFAYFFVCQIVNMVVGMLPVAAQIDAVKRQGLGSLLAFIVLYIWFVHGKAAQSGEKKKVFMASVSGRLAAGMLMAVLLLGCAGIAMNNVLALTGLKQLSGSYQTVEQAFYSSSLGWEILSLGIITPVAEELLYRDIVFFRLRDMLGRSGAVVGSALIFGLIHLNIVQTIYACALGLLLGVLMEYYQDVRVAMCGHIAANILSLLRGETGFLAWMKPGSALFVPVTFGLLAVTMVIAGLYIRTFKKE